MWSCGITRMMRLAPVLVQEDPTCPYEPCPGDSPQDMAVSARAGAPHLTRARRAASTWPVETWLGDCPQDVSGPALAVRGGGRLRARCRGRAPSAARTRRRLRPRAG